jgi:peptide-methionine (S)-S-oxide reductase
VLGAVALLFVACADTGVAASATTPASQPTSKAPATTPASQPSSAKDPAASQPSSGGSAAGGTNAEAAKHSGNHSTALFAGGCFWCLETAYEGLPGVVSVTSGYAGGSEKSPSYELVSSGRTGHTESIQIVYDPSRIGYVRLLQIFWRNIDPLQANGQFCDHGPQYRSAIFYLSEEERKAAEDSKRKLEEEPRFKGRIVTQIVPASPFYPAEEYHQDYYKKNPRRYQEYRLGCGRDARLRELWGQEAGEHP